MASKTPKIQLSARTVSLQRADASESLWSKGHPAEALAMACDAYDIATEAIGAELGLDDHGARATRFLALGVDDVDVARAEKAYTRQRPLRDSAIAPHHSTDVAALLRVVRAAAYSDVGRKRRYGLFPAIALIAVMTATFVSWCQREETVAPRWRARFYGQLDFEGELVEEYIQDIHYDWGRDSPRAGLPVDHFSARFDACLVLDEPARMQVRTGADDGLRLLVDELEVAQLWRKQWFTEASALVALEAGRHRVRLEYFEDTGDARLELTLKLDTVSSDDVLHPPEDEDCGALSSSALLTNPQGPRRPHPSMR